MATPGVNAAAAGLLAFGFIYSAPVMLVAECGAGGPGCTKTNMAMAILPELGPAFEGAALLKAGRGLRAAEIFEKAGGFTQATKDFEAIEAPEKVIGNVKLKELADGTKVVLRDFSSEASPTLEVQHASGEVTKIRYR